MVSSGEKVPLSLLLSTQGERRAAFTLFTLDKWLPHGCERSALTCIQCGTATFSVKHIRTLLLTEVYDSALNVMATGGRVRPRLHANSATPSLLYESEERVQKENMVAVRRSGICDEHGTTGQHGYPLLLDMTVNAGVRCGVSVSSRMGRR